MERQIPFLPSQSKVRLILLINPSDKILNFLAIDIRDFSGKSTLSIYIIVDVSCQYYDKLYEQLMQQFQQQQQYIWIFCTLFFILSENIKNLFRFVDMFLMKLNVTLTSWLLQFQVLFRENSKTRPL